MRVVLDTNVLVRANPKAVGSARALLDEIARSSEHALILSPFLLAEVERVLAYPRVQALWPLTPAEVEKYVEVLGDLSELVNPGPARSVVLTDPNDDPVVETALLGKADVLCTLDRHFYSASVEHFLGERSIRVINDVQLLAELRAGPRS
jgi:putative PIN family toxin of toxin-antitoxin system